MAPRTYHQALGLFFISGSTSLVYETIFVKVLSYVFGSTTQAVSTVLAAGQGSRGSAWARGLEKAAGALGIRLEEPADAPASSEKHLSRGLAALALTTGFITFAYEVTWTHVLHITGGGPGPRCRRASPRTGARRRPCCAPRWAS